jgi:hypothetical protein
MNVDDNIIKGVAQFVSIVYESIKKYNDMKPETEEEELLIGVIIARYENIRAKILSGMCDSAKNFKQLFELFTDIQVYERELESLNVFE